MLVDQDHMPRGGQPVHELINPNPVEVLLSYFKDSLDEIRNQNRDLADKCAKGQERIDQIRKQTESHFDEYKNRQSEQMELLQNANAELNRKHDRLKKQLNGLCRAINETETVTRISASDKSLGIERQLLSGGKQIDFEKKLSNIIDALNSLEDRNREVIRSERSSASNLFSLLSRFKKILLYFIVFPSVVVLFIVIFAFYLSLRDIQDKISDTNNMVHQEQMRNQNGEPASIGTKGSSGDKPRSGGPSKR